MTGSQITKYYFAGAQRVAMRVNDQLSYLVSDHLGSTSLVVKDTITGVRADDVISEMRYEPWGEVRYPSSGGLPLATQYTYTGQYSYMDDPTTGTTEGFRLMFYNARMYDPAIGRFAQADSILDNPVTGWDRYSYVNNNPLTYTDPSGNKTTECFSVRCVPHDKLDRSKLSVIGKDLYDTYIKMWNNPNGWWWDEYGDDGAFTINEFMAINWHYEQANHGNIKGYNGAVRNAASSWQADAACLNASYTCDVSTDEGSLNFLGYYSQLAKNRAAACGKGACNLNEQYNPTQWGKGVAKELVIGIRLMEPGSDFGDWDPFSVGNVSLNAAVYRKMIRNGWTISFLGGKDPMYILSYCQATFAWWAIRQGKANHTSPVSYLSAANYGGFCNQPKP